MLHAWRRLGLWASVAFGALVAGFGLVAPLDRLALDAGFALLRTSDLPSPARAIAVVGVDEQTIGSFAEPLALWHGHLADFLDATAGAGARLAAIDLVLPDRSYAGVRPDLDARLLGALLAARRGAPLVLALTVDAAGRPRRVHPPFVAAAGPEGAGFALWSRDADGVVRRFDERLGPGGERVATFAGQVLRGLGVEPREGLIDFAAGEPIPYLPLHEVAEWRRQGDEARLRAAFADKVVLLGAVLPFEDRHRVPVALSSAHADGTDPGVFVHAQAIRAQLADRVPQTLPRWLLALLGAMAGGAAWQSGRRPGWAAAGATTAIVASGTGSIAALAGGWGLPAGSLAAAAVVPALARLAGESVRAWSERRRLRHVLGGYVSPQVMAEIDAGRLDGLSSVRTFVCVLFLDVRGFTRRAEGSPPDRVVATVNELCEVATRVVHANGGTLDKFMGDGVMAFFGAPATLDNPCEAAFATARDLVSGVATLARTLESRGEDPLAVGIGIACGEATVGHIGSTARHAYTAIGDCVNVASRLEGLAKELGYPVIMARAVAERVGDDGRLVRLGTQAIRGHSPVEVFGWR